MFTNKGPLPAADCEPGRLQLTGGIRQSRRPINANSEATRSEHRAADPLASEVHREASSVTKQPLATADTVCAGKTAAPSQSPALPGARLPKPRVRA